MLTNYAIRSEPKRYQLVGARKARLRGMVPQQFLGCRGLPFWAPSRAFMRDVFRRRRSGLEESVSDGVRS